MSSGPVPSSIAGSEENSGYNELNSVGAIEFPDEIRARRDLNFLNSSRFPPFLEKSVREDSKSRVSFLF